jgi:hypothetical protein
VTHRVEAQAPVKYTLVTGVQQTYTTVKRNMTEIAERMPAEEFGFRPTPAIRSYGQLFGHLANSQFRRCAGARGEANPHEGIDFEKKTTKAEFIQALKDSFAYCDPVYAALTDANADEFVQGAGWQGKSQVTRGFALADNVTHANEMYGTACVYARLKGVVPPSSDPKPKSP